MATTKQGKTHVDYEFDAQPNLTEHWDDMELLEDGQEIIGIADQYKADIPVSKSWICNQCSFLNSATVKSCVMCTTQTQDTSATQSNLMQNQDLHHTEYVPEPDINDKKRYLAEAQRQMYLDLIAPCMSK